MDFIRGGGGYSRISSSSSDFVDPLIEISSRSGNSSLRSITWITFGMKSKMGYLTSYLTLLFLGSIGSRQHSITESLFDF